jgi:hypothetical protein
MPEISRLKSSEEKKPDSSWYPTQRNPCEWIGREQLPPNRIRERGFQCPQFEVDGCGRDLSQAPLPEVVNLLGVDGRDWQITDDGKERF